MSTTTLKRMCHDFNMSWRDIVPTKWRLRVTEENGIYRIWNAVGLVYMTAFADDVMNTLLLLNEIWEKELPA